MTSVTLCSSHTALLNPPLSHMNHSTHRGICLVSPCLYISLSSKRDAVLFKILAQIAAHYNLLLVAPLKIKLPPPHSPLLIPSSSASKTNTILLIPVCWFPFVENKFSKTALFITVSSISITQSATQGLNVVDWVNYMTWEVLSFIYEKD